MDKQAITDAINAVYSALENLEALVNPEGEQTETGEEGGDATDPRTALAKTMM